MSQSTFFTQLGITSLGAAVLLFLLHQIPDFQPFQKLSWGSLVFFMLFSVIMYFMGHRAALSDNKHLFLQQVMLTTFFKMALCIIFIVSYFKLAQPSSKMYAIPFLIVYVIFTIFETYFMMKLSKIKSN